MKKEFVLSILVLTALLACKSSMLMATPSLVGPVPEIIVLSEVLQQSHGCNSAAGVEAHDNIYSFSCSNSADTFYSVSMTRFNSETTAHTQFEASRGDNPVSCFHGFDLYETLLQDSNNQHIVLEQLSWQAGQWVVAIHDGYDYGYTHFTARGFSEAVYSSSIEHNLFLAGTCP